MTFRNTDKTRVQSKLVKEHDIKEIVKKLAKGNSLAKISKKRMNSNLRDFIQNETLKALQSNCKAIGKTP